ncbi:MAG: hypothetical protein WB623_03470, partial [Candidatus Sulfotelmatobacter sp.]
VTAVLQIVFEPCRLFQHSHSARQPGSELSVMPSPHTNLDISGANLDISGANIDISLRFSSLSAAI